MKGQEICVRGIVTRLIQTRQVGSRYPFSDQRGTFFLYSKYWEIYNAETGKTVGPGTCVEVTGKIQIQSDVPFINIDTLAGSTSGEEIEHFTPGQIRIKAQFTGQIADPRAGGNTLQPAVVTENEGLAAGRPQQVQEEPDGRGLARAIQAEEAQDFAPDNLQVQILQRGERSVPFSEAANRNGSSPVCREVWHPSHT